MSSGFARTSLPTSIDRRIGSRLVPRTGRGGRRRGIEGRTYTNRSDLQTGPRQPIRVATGAPYGQRQQLENAQRAMPLAAPSPPPDIVPLDAPTARPDEPLTAGAPFGAGPGPEALGMAMPADEVEELRAVYARFPSEELRQLLEEAEGPEF